MTVTERTARVARVAVDVPFPHLDRLFDYAIPDALVERVRPGVRCRVRFAGKLRDGFVVEVGDSTEVVGKLALLERVASDEVVMTPQVVRLLRAVADHWAGTFADVARQAIPPRHAATEAATPPDYADPRVDTSLPSVLQGYPGADAYLNALSAGQPIRAAWTPVAVRSGKGDGQGGVLDAVAATLGAGKGAIVVVPDADALARLEKRCGDVFGVGSFVTLSADLGPAVRYRHFVAVARGHVRLVIGTRASVYAPVRNLGLVVVWDEGNDLLAEPRAPYPNAREVAALRSVTEPCALLLSGFGRSVEVQALVDRGWMGSLQFAPAKARREGPAVKVAVDNETALARDPAARSARLPHEVFVAIRSGLALGPVLVQVPHSGYVASLVCQGCREPAACPRCGKTLRGDTQGQELVVSCPGCGWSSTPWRCPHCGESRLRAPRIGIVRTSEELGKAFPKTKIVRSSAGHIVANVDDCPQLVLATPGAEPNSLSGYAAAVLLDTEQSTSRADLRAVEEALRRWLVVCSDVRPGADGGTVIAVGDPASRVLQALVRRDPVGFAQRELGERSEAHLPPASRVVAVEGDPDAVSSFADELRAPRGTERFGPAPDADGVRLILRVPARDGRLLVAAVKEVQCSRSARKAPVVRVRVDPDSFG